MPAILATDNTSPFFKLLERMSERAVAFEKCTEQTAVARRVVGDLWEIGTMWAEPVGVRCVSFGS